ncbi:MAG: Crp/Fnr family transcriptional regulator [Ktedonobacteraceae bacterium]|nr:Crp/Fnr family transcriptional regulator [Ktedonobacteraceae bacterium]
MGVDIAELRRIAMFRTLSDEDLAYVAAVTKIRRYGRGEIIFFEGERNAALYYVQAGLVKVFKTSTGGREQILRLIAAGYTFNDVPALDGGPNPASAAALEPSTIYVIGHSQLQALIAAHPAIATGVIRMLAAALRHLVSLIEDLSLRHVTARIAKLLLDEATTVPMSRAAHRLTQQELAAMAGTVREVAGRALKELEAAGAIELRQGHITIANQQCLKLIAENVDVEQ